MGCFFGSRFIKPTKAFFSLVKSKEGKRMKQKRTVQPQDQRSVVYITNPPSALPHDYSLTENNNNTLSRHNIRKEVKLWNNKREWEMYERFADVSAIIKTTEKLEKLYVRGIIPSSEYETECQQLIFQFKTLAFMLKDVTGPSIEQFASTYQMDCPAALHRLVTSGVPATVEHHRASAAVTASSTICLATVAECVQDFITAMDSLKLNMLGVDQIYPLLSHISASLGRLTFDFEGKTKMEEWKSRLSKMSPADELTEQQAQQLHFDLELSYDKFMEALQVRHYLP